MALRVVCDRCAKQADAIQDGSVPYPPLWCHIVIKKGAFTEIDRWLCDGCLARFGQWMAQGSDRPAEPA